MRDTEDSTPGRPIAASRAVVAADSERFGGIGATLERAGWEVRFQPDPETALLASVEEGVGLVVLDWSGLGRSATALARRLRGAELTERPAILALDGQDSTETPIEIVLAGADEWLAHPAPDGELLGAVDRALRLARRPRGRSTEQSGRRRGSLAAGSNDDSAVRRARTEVELRRSRERYRAVVHGIEDGYYEIDLRGTLTFFNEPMAAILGYTPGEMATLNGRDFTAPEYAEKVFAWYGRLLEMKASARDVRWEIIRKDGRTRTVEVSASPILDEEGGVVGFRGIVRDVTDRQKTEEELLSLRKAVETTQIGVTITDRAGTILYTNPADARMHGYEVTELLGKNARIFAPAPLWQPLRQKQIEGLATLRRESVNVRKDGSSFPVLLISDVVTNAAGERTGIVTTCQDLTEQKRAEEALRESEIRYAAARGANDGLWDWDLATGELEFSPRWKSMLGFAENEVGHRAAEWFDRVHPDDLAGLEGAIREVAEGRRVNWEGEHRVRTKAGEWRWMLVRAHAARDSEGRTTRIAGSQTDVTERRLATERLIHDAFHDGLTGLPNRARFLERLSESLERGRRRRDYLFAVLFLDADGFKVVNDGLGHMTGDQLLVQMGERFRRELRGVDTIARFGGDEFTILLDELKDTSEPLAVAGRLQRALSEPFELDGNEVFVGASVGIVIGPAGYTRPEEMLRDADIAMYRAKAEGRGTSRVFDRAMHDRAVARLRLENDLRRAVERNEFELHFQPVVTLPGHRPAGLEALVRWHHPTDGLVNPVDFIPVAEQTGLILPIGNWVLREACRQLAAWQPAGGAGFVAVNLSMRQFLQPDLVGSVRSALEESGLEPGRLHLELTESVLAQNADATAEMLGQLRELGVKLEIDDFGTGYSSLSYLQRLPIDGLKVDRSFVARLEVGLREIEIVRTIVALGRALGIRVTAEGVETRFQAETLSRLGCGFGQGYLFSRPATAATAAGLVLAAQLPMI